MNLIKLVGVTSLLISGLTFAAPSCDGFQIKLKNNLADDLIVTKIKLDGAQIQPNGFEKLNSKTEQVFTVNGSSENLTMSGHLKLRTVSLPSKTVTIRFELNNKLATCNHEDMSPASDYSVEKSRNVGGVEYVINNK